MADRYSYRSRQQQRSLRSSRYRSSHWLRTRTYRCSIVALLGISATVFFVSRYASFSSASESTSVLYRPGEKKFTGALRAPAERIPDLGSQPDKKAPGNRTQMTMDLNGPGNTNVSKHLNSQEEQDEVHARDTTVDTSKPGEVGKPNAHAAVNTTSVQGHNKTANSSTSEQHTLTNEHERDPDSMTDTLGNSSVQGGDKRSQQRLSAGPDLQKRDVVKKVSACMCRQAEPTMKRRNVAEDSEM